MRNERKLQKARRKYGIEHEVTESAQRECSRSRTKYVNAIRYNKKSWLNCVQESSSEDPWGAAYKILAGKLKKATQMVTLKVNGRTISDPSKIAKAMMMDGLVPDDEEDDCEELREIRRFAEEPVTEWENEPVTIAELKTAVFKQRSGKAPGMDGVRAEVTRDRMEEFRL